MHRDIIKFLAIMSFCLVAGSAAFAAGGIKCWVNSQNVRECGDRIPLEYIKQEIDYISKRGWTLKIRAAAKTPEQIAEEKIQLAKLQKEERIREIKARKDRVLLKTYSSIDDLLYLMTSKLNIISSKMQIVEKKYQRVRKTYRQYVASAADYERAGRTIPAKISNNLVMNRNSLENTRKSLNSWKKKREDIEKLHYQEVEHYMYLTVRKMLSRDVVRKDNLIVVRCRDISECNQVWELSEEYMAQTSLTPIKISLPTVLLTDLVEQDDEIGAVLTRVNEGDGARMVLQLRCHNSPLGKQYCDSEDASDILFKYPKYIEKHWQE